MGGPSRHSQWWRGGCRGGRRLLWERGAVGVGGGSGWGCLMLWWEGVGGRSCVIGASGRGKYGRWDVGSVWCGVYRRRNLRFLVMSLPEPSVRTEY